MAKRKKAQKDKQRSTKHTHKTKDRVTRTPLKTEGELRCSGRVSYNSSPTRFANIGNSVDYSCIVLYIYGVKIWRFYQSDLLADICFGCFNENKITVFTVITYTSKLFHGTVDRFLIKNNLPIVL